MKNDMIAGFGDIDESGYLDRLYVHKDYQNQGIAAAICDELEQSVRADKITTHASVMAKPFFEHRGYKVVRVQQVIRGGIPLILLWRSNLITFLRFIFIGFLYRASARRRLVLFVCPKTEGGVFVSGKRAVPAGSAGEHLDVFLDRAD